MKKTPLLITAFLLSAVTILAQPNTWTQKADFGGVARNNAVGFSIGGKAYIGTGTIQSSQTPLKDFWEYDAATNAWTKKADFPGDARNDAVGFSIGNKGYIGGGGAGYYEPYFKDFWEYDPATDKWTRKADLPGIARHMAAAFSIGNKGYYGTGKTESPYAFYKDFWEYDPATDKWTQKADYGGGPIDNVSFFAIGSKGYMGCGYYSGWVKTFYEYDPATDKWTRKADFGGSAREYAVGLSIGNKGYIGTGYPQRLKDFWEYDPVANIWTRKADVGGNARALAVGFSIGSKGYIGTGNDNVTDLKDFWEYTPDCIIPNTPGEIKGKKYDLCGGGKLYYSIDTVPGAVYYTWSVPANTSVVAGQGSNTILLKINSNFEGGNLSVTANSLCGFSNPSISALNIKPQKPSAINGPSTVSAYQKGVVFSVQNKGDIYNWTVVPVDAVITSGWGTSKITVTWGSTSGYVAVSASNNCGLSETRTKAVSVSGFAASSPNQQGGDALNISPNPVIGNVLTVHLTSKSTTNIQLIISDLQGQSFINQKLILNNGILNKAIDVSALPEGAYILKTINNKNEQQQIKFVKAN